MPALPAVHDILIFVPLLITPNYSDTISSRRLGLSSAELSTSVHAGRVLLLKVNAAFAWGPILELVEHILYRNAPPLTTMPISRPAEHSSSARSIISGALPTVILMTVLWWVLTGGPTGSWIVGIPVIILATGASLWFRSHDLWMWRLAGLCRFFPVFVWQSLRAGLEVALLAFHPRRPLAPGLLIYHLRLPTGPSRIFFTNTLSLSPGTFSADLEGDRLTIHVLDEQFLDRENLQFMESLVAELFGIQLAPESSSQEVRHE